MHTEDWPIVCFNCFHKKDVSPDAHVPRGRSRESHLFSPPVHRAHHRVGFPQSAYVAFSSFTALFHSRHLKSVYGLRMKKVWLSFSTSSISKCGLWLPQLGMTSVPLCSEVLSLRCCVNRFFVSCQLGWMELELSWSVRGHE